MTGPKEYWVITYQCKKLTNLYSSWTIANEVTDKDPLTWLSEINEKYVDVEERVLLNCFITSDKTKAKWCLEENGGEI